MAPASHCIGSVPSDVVGLLIGRGGKNIQELERLSDCRLRIVPSKECEGMTDLHVLSFSCKVVEQKQVAVSLFRAAGLVCQEGTTVEQAWQKAKEERQRAEKLKEACRLQMAARKLCVVCPEMNLALAVAALQQSEMDEDRALDLFYQGAIVIQNDDKKQRSADSIEQDRAVHNDFPVLKESSSAGSVSETSAWCPKQVMKTRVAHGISGKTLNAEDAESFPSLPTAKASGQERLASKVTAKGNRKHVARTAVNCQCPSVRSSACGQVPKTKSISGIDLVSLATHRRRC
eukprot:gnl/MRDRNA2_/MRDRNA2_73390_c0_seq2.p1 gnl/MRDRNA2_/MRDRNA2_73390_c0~~gnl/MRDRNA2_/MRDRNA2_73390_c0_seq2.p1  ORF type:complete len:323 (+),score=53.92 gnl/MRDRNA2_/MRDRNA2_73390_c0_seq2:103-969(+)